MNKRVLLIVIGVAVLILLGILASQVGGIAIRRTANQGDQVNLTVAEAILPGVETSVRFTSPMGIPNSEVEVRVRSLSGETTLGKGRLSSGSIKVVFPCDIANEDASVTLWDTRTSQLLASQEVEILSAGPDCLR